MTERRDASTGRKLLISKPSRVLASHKHFGEAQHCKSHEYGCQNAPTTNRKKSIRAFPSSSNGIESVPDWRVLLRGAKLISSGTRVRPNCRPLRNQRFSNEIWSGVRIDGLSV